MLVLFTIIRLFRSISKRLSLQNNLVLILGLQCQLGSLVKLGGYAAT